MDFNRLQIHTITGFPPAARQFLRESNSSKIRIILLFLLLLTGMSPALQAQFVQQAGPLVGTGATGIFAWQGRAVAVSEDGNTAVVGAPHVGGGGVNIYVRTGTTWTQQGTTLTGTDGVGTTASQQGEAVDISADGNTIIFGYPSDNGIGAVWIFTRTGTTWTQQGSKLIGTGGTTGAYQGVSVALSADGNTAIIGGSGDNNNQGAAWVFTRSGTTWTQQGAKLVSTGGTTGAYQGTSVALSADGNTAVIGGQADNNHRGAVWIWTRSGTTWTQQGSKLVGTGAVGMSIQGSSVDISGDGNTVIAGGSYDNSGQGAAWIFIRSGTTWTQQGAKLAGTGAVGNARQGHSVAISNDGNTAIIGGYADNNDMGATWVFTRSGTVWTQQGSKLVGSGAADAPQQGISIDISGDGHTLITGGWRDFHSNGASWIFIKSEITWIQQGTKLAVTDYPGMARQGSSIAISADGNTAIVGGPYDYYSMSAGVVVSGKGAVWIWTKSGNTWTQQGSKLVGTGAVGNAMQGYSVAISADGNTAVVGGYTDNYNQGAVWIFTRSGNTWTQQGSKLVGTGAVGAAYQGTSVGISADGNTVIVGGSGDNNNQGAAWVFTRSGNTWTQQGSKLVGTGHTGEAQQGFSVGISGDANTAVIGGVNSDNGKGAAWIFTRSGNTWTQQGSRLSGTEAVVGSRQGWSVDISADGNTTIVGAPVDNYTKGAAWIFIRSGNTWTQQGSKLVGSGNISEGWQGRSVAISGNGNTAVVGGHWDNSGQGAVWIFTRSGNTWTQQGSKLVASGAIGRPEQGKAVDISADAGTVLIGAPMHNDWGTGGFWSFSPTTDCNATPTAGTSPANTSLCAGNTTTLTVNGASVGGGITYQWQESDDNGVNDAWTNAVGGSGAATVSYTTPNTLTGIRYYRLKVNCANSGISSYTSSVQVKADQMPVITVQPADREICLGGNASFFVAATGAALTYQWQRSTDNGATFTNIAGATNDNYEIFGPSLSANGQRYRVVISSGACSVTSSAAILTVGPPLAITTQPSAQATCEGNNATFTVGAVGAGLTYQWYVSTNNGTSYTAIPNATAASLTLNAVNASMDGYQYRVSVYDICDIAVSSNAVALTVQPALAISAQPSAQTACQGSNATFAVTAGGAGIAYQWEVSTDNGATFSPVSGATAASYTVNGVTMAMNGHQYRVVVSGTCTTAVTSSAVALTVNTAPSITAQPTAQTVCAGADASFAVNATGSGLIYQWEVSTDNGVTFSPIAGATAAGYTATAVTASMNGEQYRVVVSGTCAPAVTSSAVVLTVNTAPSITAQPTAQAVCAGTNAIFAATATGTGLSYQWEVSTDNGATFSPVTGATTAGYTATAVTASMNGYEYRVVISGICAPSVTSSAVALTVNTAPSITAQPTSQTACVGKDAVFYVAATGSGLTYQWEISTNNGATFSAITGATAASYTASAVTTSMNGYQYRVVISGTCAPSVVSTAAHLVVNPPLAIITHPVSQTVCTGSSATFTVNATGAGLSYTWQMSTNNGASYSDIAGANAASYTTIAGVSGYYRVIVKSICAEKVISSVAALNVSGTLQIDGQPAAQTVCQGSSALFEVVASGSGLSYQWEVNTGTGFTAIAGATSASYTTAAATASMNGYQYRVVVSGSCASSVTSSAVVLSVNTVPAITAQPTAQTVCAGANAVFAASATGTGLSYQWEINTGTGFTPITGATAASYIVNSVTTSMNGHLYRVVVSGTCAPSVTSSTVALTVNTSPAITTQPTAQTVCAGANAVFSATATGTGFTYQWQQNTGTGFTNIAGATAASYTVVAAAASMNGYQYRVIVSGTCAPSVTSNTAALTVNTSHSITAQPTASTVCAGTNAVFNVTANGSGLTYQWQQNTGAGFTNIAGATAASYTTAAVTASMNGYQYRVVVSGTCASSLTSSAALLSVNATPAITTQPTTRTVCAGANAVFNVTATGHGLSYQWQQNTGTGFTNITGATASSYTVAAVTASMNGYQYRVVVSGTCAPSVTSAAALLSINTTPAITAQPTAQTVCAGANAVFNVTATGSGLSYQWQRNSGSGFLNITGATAASYTAAAVTAPMNGYQYRVIISGTCAPSVTSTAVVLSVNTAPSITSQPANAAACTGGNATFSATATGTGLTYQWQRNTGTGFISITGATASSYTATAVTASMNGYQYRVVVSGTCAPSVTSATASLSVNPAPVISTQPASQSICEGANVTFTIAASGTGLSYQWQQNAGSGFANIAGATSASYTASATTASMNNYQYRVLVSGACTTITSGTATLTVAPRPVITAQPLSVQTCEGTNATFSATVSATGAVYQWERSTDGGNSYSPIAGANTTSYTENAVTYSMNNHLYRLVISNCGTPVISNEVTLQILRANDAPTIDPVANVEYPNNTSYIVIPLTGISAGNVGDAITITATSSDPGFMYPSINYSSPSATANLVLYRLHNAEYPVQITVKVKDNGSTSGACGRGIDETTIVFRVTIQDTYYYEQFIQSIYFEPIGDQYPGAAPVTMYASATSGMGIIYEVNSGPAFINANGQLEVTGLGTVVVTAIQPGNSIWFAAVATQSFNVVPVGPGAVRGNAAATENSPEMQLNAWPNPSEGRFTVEMALEQKSDVRITVTNSLGSIVYQSEVKAAEVKLQTQISLEDQPTGMYMLRVEANGKTMVKKLVKSTF